MAEREGTRRTGRSAIFTLPAVVAVVAVVALLLSRCGDGGGPLVEPAPAVTAGTSTVPRPTTTSTAVRPTTTAATTTTTLDTTTSSGPATGSTIGPDVAPDLLTVLADGPFKSFLAAVSRAGLTSVLSGASPLTVFAPTDAAFAKVAPETLDRLTADPATLARVLRGHLVNGSIPRDQLQPGPLTSLSGTHPIVSIDAISTKFAAAVVELGEITASNGIVHPLDMVVLPIDILPVTQAPAVVGDIVATAVAAGTFTTFTKALQAAGLAAVLESAGPYTVFMPTDQAFANLPPGVLDQLNTNKIALAKVLSYHVLAGRLSTSDLSPGDHVTVAGSTVAIAGTTGNITVNTAQLIRGDIPATNGVIHVIDVVLLPPDLHLEQPPSNGPEYTVYFDTSSSFINAAGRSVIETAAQRIAQLPSGTSIVLTGVADARGDAAANQRLSKARAESVRQALVRALEPTGRTYDFVIAAKGAEAGTVAALARRVEIDLP